MDIMPKSLPLEALPCPLEGIGLTHAVSLCE